MKRTLGYTVFFCVLFTILYVEARVVNNIAAAIAIEAVEGIVDSFPDFFTPMTLGG